MDKSNKPSIMFGAIYAIIFAVYNLLVFLIFKDLTAVFWISWVFMLIAFGLHVACTFSVVKNANVKAVFFGIPLLSFSLYFVCAELFASLVFMIFRENCPVKVAVAVQVILLAAFLVVAIVSILTRDTVTEIADNVKKKSAHIQGLAVDVEMLMTRSTDIAVTEKLRKLHDTIQYSDPMTNEAVAMQDQMIMQYMTQLRMTFDDGNMAAVAETCDKLELLFMERNKKLMISK